MTSVGRSAPTARSDPPQPPSVSLHDAAEMLGVTEAEMLMRVFRNSIPSVVAPDGTRRVPLVALDSVLARAPAEPEADSAPPPPPPSPSPPSAAIPSAELEALTAGLDDARSRLSALEAQPHRSTTTLAAAVDSLAGELEGARSRIAALEALAARPAPLDARELRDLALRWLHGLARRARPR